MAQWKTYEEVTKAILIDLQTELGLWEVSEGRSYPGQAGTTWNIDVSARREGSDDLVIFECRRQPTTRIKQEEMAAFAYRVRDIGAAAGIVVTPLGLQQGAELIAQAERIETILLNPDASVENYVAQLSNR